MKLRYVSKFEPFALRQTGTLVRSGDVVDVKPHLAADLMAKYPKSWFEEKDVGGKQAEEKLTKQKTDRAKAKEAAAAKNVKMAVNAGKTK